MMFSADQVKAAIDALAGGDGAAALEILQALLTAAASGEDPTKTPDKGAPPAAAGAGAQSGNAETAPPEMAALARGVIALFGGDAGSALVAVTALKAESDARTKDAAVLESAERRTLTAELVKLGVEVPGTAWIDPDQTGDALAPAEHIAKMPIATLRKRVSLIKSTRTAGTAPGHRPPAGPAAKRALNKNELAYCKRHNITADEFEARKATAVRGAQ